MNDYIELGPSGQHKHYKVVAPEYVKQRSRPKTIMMGLTGKHIIQDFTVGTNDNRAISLLLRAASVPTGTVWGSIDDIYTAYAETTLDYVDFDGTTKTVTVANVAPPQYQVYADLYSSNSVAFVKVDLIEVNQ